MSKLGSSKGKDSQVIEKETQATVVKRNGMIAPFQRERIYLALEAAIRDTKGLEKNAILNEEHKQIAETITNLVMDEALRLSEKKVSLTVEGIQDLVEVTLMKNDHHDIARDYIIYRDKQKELRKNSYLNLKIKRKDATIRFNPIKIASSIEKSFRRTYQITDNTPQEIIEAVNILTQDVVKVAAEHAREQEDFSILHIQDLVEEKFMSEGYFEVAKDYILYRAEKGTQTPFLEKTSKKHIESGKQFTYITKDGKQKKLSESAIKRRLKNAMDGLSDVNFEDLLESVTLNFYEGMKEEEIDTAYLMATKARIEAEPNYSFVASRLLLDKLYKETLNISFFDASLAKEHKKYFKSYFKHGVSIGRISEKLLNFDLDKLADSIDLQRDYSFAYLGIQTLYDRYFIHENEKRLETPQLFWMRVAMGLAVNEKKKEEKAIEFYNVMSKFQYIPGTPTLFNSGTQHSQLSSCYLSTISDDLGHIFKIISDDAQLSKWAGGLGNDWTNVRATGSVIKGTNGKSQGIIPFLKVANDTAVAVNQGGKRKGAMCAYLETWHLDIEDFLELRKNTGDERRRTHDMNTANWIPDLFMKRVKDNQKWTLFSPSDTPDLHDLYGAAFEKRYAEYEAMTKDGELTNFKEVEALDLWRKMLSMLFETGHPWITFKDPSNIRSPQDHRGVVHSSNLCTEILLNTSESETAVCNLGSINLIKHIDESGLVQERLASTVQTAIRMLDNVIDINFYPIEEAKNANMQHRAIGLGLMGFQDALYMQNISYASHESAIFADKCMEMISYYAILSSSLLAKERGTYPSYDGSKWQRGLLPIDTIDLLEKERGLPIKIDRDTHMDWNIVRKTIKENGMRNCNTMAIAPTATIANIIGVTSSVEPTYKHLFAKSNLSGEFTVINTYLVDELKKRNLWNDQLLDDLKYFDGSIAEIEAIPDEIKQTFLTAFEIEPDWIIACAAKRQKWIDMGQSLNLYLSEPSGKKMHNMYMLAWEKGLKTTYYLRSLGATQIEKSTTDINKRGLQPKWMKNESPSSRVQVNRDKPAPSCNLEEGCESCQ